MVRRRRDVVANADACSSLSLCVATANVLTLHASDETLGHCLGARAETLASQFIAAGIHAVGLQETRLKMTGHSFFMGFHVLAGPATHRGQGGVQAWIRQSIPTPQDPVQVEAADLRILHATSRRLVVRWAHPGCRLLFVVVHAASNDKEDELELFWDATTAAVPTAYRRWNTIVFG